MRGLHRVSHGFLRAVDGQFTFFDVPDAGAGPGQGTFPMTNTLGDTVTGFYVDSHNVWHGFVRK